MSKIAFMSLFVLYKSVVIFEMRRNISFLSMTCLMENMHFNFVQVLCLVIINLYQSHGADIKTTKMAKLMAGVRLGGIENKVKIVRSRMDCFFR